jgi:hypothetical protein
LSNLFSRNTINNHFYGEVDVRKVNELNQAQMDMLTGHCAESPKQQYPAVEPQETEPQLEGCEQTLETPNNKKGTPSHV